MNQTYTRTLKRPGGLRTTGQTCDRCGFRLIEMFKPAGREPAGDFLIHAYAIQLPGGLGVTG